MHDITRSNADLDALALDSERTIALDTLRPSDEWPVAKSFNSHDTAQCGEHFVVPTGEFVAPVRGIEQRHEKLQLREEDIEHRARRNRHSDFVAYAGAPDLGWSRPLKIQPQSNNDPGRLVNYLGQDATEFSIANEQVIGPFQFRGESAESNQT